MDLQVRWSALNGQNKQVAVTEDGGCWTWGFGANGRLGHGNEERVISPKKIPPKLLHGAKAVMAACSSLLAGHTALVTDDGRLWTWGRGSEGQLGHHDMQAKMVPTLIARELFGGAFIALVACGGSHTACVTNVGALWSWGAGEWGQLGHGDIERREVPVLVKGTGEGGVRIVVVSCGDRNTAAVTSMVQMFNSAISFNCDLDEWDVRQVTSLNNMFTSANSFNGDISTWDTRSVVDLTSTFHNAAR